MMTGQLLFCQRRLSLRTIGELILLQFSGDASECNLVAEVAILNGSSACEHYSTVLSTRLHPAILSS